MSIVGVGRHVHRAVGVGAHRPAAAPHLSAREQDAQCPMALRLAADLLAKASLRFDVGHFQ